VRDFTTFPLALVSLTFLLQASPAQRPTTCGEGPNLSRVIDQAQRLAPPELIDLGVTLVIAPQKRSPARLVQASFGVPLLAAAKIKNESKKIILSYRIGWSYVHDNQMEFHSGDLRIVPTGIRPGTTQDVAGQSIPMADAQQVIFFVAELTFSDGKHWTSKKQHIQIGRN
jgi:hypothetical protein